MSMNNGNDIYIKLEHSHDIATQDKDGFMSAEDKIKLDGISNNGQQQNMLIPFNNCGELEDLIIRTGTFYNAGAGWNTFTFSEPLEGSPMVVCHCDGYNIEIKNASKTGFLYRVVKDVASSLNPITKTLYEYDGSSTSTTYRYITNYKNSTQDSAFNVLTSLSLSDGDSSVSDAVEIKYTAIANHHINTNSGRVIYIESSGEQYIDTGFHPNTTTTRIEAKFRILGGTDTNGIFGCRPTNSSTVDSFCVFYNIGKNGKLFLDLLGSRIGGQDIAIGTDVVIDSLNNTATVNGQQFSSSVAKTSKTLEQKIFVFNVHNVDKPFYGVEGATGKEGTRMRLYYFKIYDNDMLLYDFVPFINSDGEAGLYDMVGDKFYGNAGKGQFITP